MATASFALAGALAFTIAPSANAAPGGDPKAFANEASLPGFTANTLTDLSAKCPQGIAGTPGSDPSTKFLNDDLNDGSSFGPGGTVHYSYIDNPNFASQNYQIDDCVAVYPEATFGAGDVDPITHLVNSATVSKSDLNKGVKVDAASFSGVLDSTGSTYFNWTAPANLQGGQWVCNFARDIATGHGGGGNRKVLPVCYQVPKAEVDPTAPTFAEGACGEQDTVTIPETAAEGVTYYLDLPETLPDGKTKADYAVALGSVTSLATGDHVVTEEDGDGGVIGTWPYTATAVEEQGTCNPTVTPNVPTHPTSACGKSDTYVIPVDEFFDFVLVTSDGEGETTTPIADGSHDLAAGVVVHIRAVKHDVSDTTTGTTDWEFTGRAITACRSTGGGGDPTTTTTSTTEAPTTTTTVAPTTTTTVLPELPFTPEPEVVTTTTTTMAPAPELAFTGSNSGYLAMMGLVLVGFGGLLFGATSRKRRTNS